MSSSGLVELRNSALSAVIDPHGAQLMSLKTSQGQELIWQGDPQVWRDHAPILFPVISETPSKQVRIGEQSYPMPPHGFAKVSDFAVTHQTETHCIFELRDSPETRTYYPFAFTLRVEYDLSESGLLTTIEVENRDSQTMPADIGFHPGFNWPLTPGRVKEDYSIVFAEEEPAPIRRGTGSPAILYPDSQPTPVEGRVLKLRDELFEPGPITFDRLNSRSLTFGAPNALSLQIDFPDCPYLTLWMRPGAPYLAIEPWQGLPAQIDFDGQLADKPGIALIPPGDTGRWRLDITLQPARS